MKAKVSETCSGGTFRAIAGTILNDDIYSLEENHVFMKTTDIQSVINMGAAFELKEKPVKK